MPIVGDWALSVSILKGDCRDVLRDLPAESVHCCVCSPPYWGLRSYIADGDPLKPLEIGLDADFNNYIATMVEVFREVWRVLRNDGTVWLNLGDSYATGAGAVGECPGGGKQGARWRGEGSKHDYGLGPMTQPNRMPQPGLKAKNLCGIPWRVAFALQADGWYLRQDIIWSKPNPMPESVRDRCTKAHEYIFLLSKSERYYYDAEAIAEAAIHAGREINYDGSQKNCAAGDAINDRRTLIDRPVKVNETRNKRSVWEVTTSPFPEAHFATFPPALIEPCILAGCPEKCCAKCGAPVVRVMETDNPSKYAADTENTLGWANTHSKTSNAQSSKSLHRNPGGVYSSAVFKGWEPSCSCNAGTVGGTVLDPFGGAGTTGLVADRLGRNAVMIELNPEYAAMAERRIKGDAGMFAEVTLAVDKGKPTLV